jgi:hypothetical protein
LLLTFLPLDLVLHDRTTGVAGIRSVRRNGEDRVVSDLEADALGSNRDSSDSGRALADALDVLADDLDIQAHGPLHVAENSVVGDTKWFAQSCLLP